MLISFIETLPAEHLEISMKTRQTKEKRHASYLRNKDKIIAAIKIYSVKNKDKIAATKKIYNKINAHKIKERRRLKYIQDRENILAKRKLTYQVNKHSKITYQRGLHLKKKYFPEFTIDQALKAYADLLHQQNGLCAICDKPEIKRDRQNNKVCALAVDHCHTTKRVRGLLCFTCNTNLGRFERNIPKVLNYIGYKNE